MQSERSQLLLPLPRVGQLLRVTQATLPISVPHYVALSNMAVEKFSNIVSSFPPPVADELRVSALSPQVNFAKVTEAVKL